MGRKKLRKDPQAVIEGEPLGGLKHTYNFPSGLSGYSGQFDSDVVGKVQNHPDVSILSGSSP